MLKRTLDLGKSWEGVAGPSGSISGDGMARPRGNWPGQRGRQEGRQGGDSYERTGGSRGGLEAAEAEAGLEGRGVSPVGEGS